MFRKAILFIVLVAPLVAHAAGNAPALDAAGDFRPVQVSELSRHLGKQVRISMPRGVVREGTLTDATPSIVTVERNYGRGGMKFEVMSKQIEKAEVRD